MGHNMGHFLRWIDSSLQPQEKTLSFRYVTRGVVRVQLQLQLH